MYERFTGRARKVMDLANQEARSFYHEYVGTEHILLGLLKEGSGVAAIVLKNLDIDLADIQRQVETIVEPCPDSVIVAKLPPTPRVKRVIEYAIDEARDLKHNYVGTEHLLLGLLHEDKGLGSQILGNIGLDLGWLREEVMNLLDPQRDPASISVPFKGRRHHVRVEDLPAEIQQALVPFDSRIETLNQQKESAIAESDFERAYQFCNQAAELKRSRKRILVDWCTRPLPDPSWLTWNHGSVATIARAIGEEYRWGDLPILADALEEAGCKDQELLNHCREPGDHGGGCWAVALLLGKK
jgi:ATP-dependent Clp protease ATP-binding subunit ClpA